MSYYLIKEEGCSNDIFAIILKRVTEKETLKAIITAINDKFNCDSTAGYIKLEQVTCSNPELLHITAGKLSLIVEVSTVLLY